MTDVDTPRRYSPARRAVMFGLPIALLALLATGGCAMFRYPAINDISTDLADPPAFTHATTLSANEGRDMTYPPDFVPVVKKHYPDLQPLRVELDSEEAFVAALLATGQMTRWEVTWSDRAAGLIEVVATTALLRFKDDVVIRLRPGIVNERGNPTTEIDMRSKSRLGRSDFGANAKRIRAYFDQLETAIEDGAESGDDE